MSINGSSGMLSDGYGNIESQRIGVVQSYSGAADVGGTATTVAKETPTGDLDRNELAELVFFRLTATTSIRSTSGDDQGGTGNARNDITAFINEEPQGVQADQVETSDVGPGINNLDQVGGAANDAAGLLTKFNQVVHPMFLDDTSGAGGGGDGGETTVIEMNYADIGGGPVLDRFDDIALRSSLSANDVLSEVKTEVRLQLYYKVEEFEDRGGFQSFGRP